ncbi:TfuA-like protein [Streptomyces sp. DSM 44917]|uniref:TfuA-like protein n=1 Tax=Streptomyces boetiae TaxID=3075541 RepID=A0ABU2LFT0_9ACTN|nr:TfuA-like protein [Streptomyces sp. DSM 44917]MDT0310444.1 TfuA-like protein [Streptomyces sp. DSM 44917]
MTVHVYVGPTVEAGTVRDILPRAELHPPIRHGDLLCLRTTPSDIVLVIDGLFLHAPPVRHKEILRVLARGTRVVGASSMGALRAAELDRFGMLGVGTVFEMYRTGGVTADDEVAVTHDDGEGFTQYSDALVNMRHAVKAATAEGVVTGAVGAAIISVARDMPFSVRSWPNVQREAAGNERLTLAILAIREFLSSRPEHANIKRTDAIVAAHTVRAMEKTSGESPSWAEHPSWQTVHLSTWASRYAAGDGRAARTLGAFRYQQIYDQGFPDRWRDWVLRSCSDIFSDTRVPQEAADYWLTPDERRALDDGERQRRLLVRSYRIRTDFRPPFGPITGDFLAQPVDAAALARVDECQRIEQQLTKAAGRALRPLRAALVLEHVAEVWHLPPQDYPALEAHARDRAFLGIDEAVDAARPFLLGHLHRSGAVRSRPGERIDQRQHGQREDR